MHRRCLEYAVPRRAWLLLCRPVKQFESLNNFVPGCVEQVCILQLQFSHDFPLKVGVRII